MKSKEEWAKEWAKRGFSCDLWVDPPGQRWENYVHDRDELLALAEGTLEVEINGKKQILETDKEVLIPAGVYHSVRNVGGTTAKWFYGYRNS